MSQEISSPVTYLSRGGWYSLDLPANWGWEETEVSTAFFGPDGVGALHISAYQAPGRRSAEQLLIEYMAEDDIDGAQIDKVQNGERETANCFFERPPDFFKLWFVVEGNQVVFVSYIHEIGAASAEDDEVERIVASLKFRTDDRSPNNNMPAGPESARA